MKILHIGRVSGAPHSGVANVVPKYLEFQAKYANVALLNISSHTPANAANNYQVFHLKSMIDGIKSLQAPFSSPDLVVFHEVYWPSFIGVAKYLKKNDIPYVITPHVSLTDTAQNNKRVKKMLANLLVVNAFIKNAKAIHYLSESEMLQSSKFNQLPYFIRNNGIEIKGRIKRDFNKDKLRIIYVGRLEIRIKGLDRLLKAAAIIRKEMMERNIHISIYGADQDNNKNKIKEMIDRYQLTDVVTLGDAIYGEEKIKEITSSDCFIQLSRTEGQPLAVMEAMDIGMPCLVTKGTTFHEVACRDKVAIPVNDDPLSIARTIIDIRNGNHPLDEISKKASEYTAQNFDWNKLGMLMIEDYRKLIADQD